MNKNPVEKSFLTTRQAATLLGVSVGTVQLWVENGLLKAWKTTGGHRRVLRDSVDALLHKTPAQSLASAAAPVQVAPALQVLVVEDDENQLRLYQAMMNRWPLALEVSYANNAISALLMMGRNPPDLLITDLVMPGMDGYGMLHILCQDAEMRHTKIVVVTGLEDIDVVHRGSIPPGIEILNKPVPFARLLEIATEQAAKLNPAQFDV